MFLQQPAANTTPAADPEAGLPAAWPALIERARTPLMPSAAKSSSAPGKRLSCRKNQLIGQPPMAVIASWWQGEQWFLALGLAHTDTIDGPGREFIWRDAPPPGAVAASATTTANCRLFSCTVLAKMLTTVVPVRPVSSPKTSVRSAPGASQHRLASARAALVRQTRCRRHRPPGNANHRRPGDSTADITDRLGPPPAENAPRNNNLGLPPAPSARPFTELVEEGRMLVELGAIRKVVLARSEDIALPQPVDPWHVLDELLHDTEAKSVAYLIDLPVGGTFLGLTPEHLFSLHGRQLTTHALAGSRKRGDTEAEDIELAAELLANTKERKEHNLVVEHLNRQLHRRTENNLDVPGTPTVRKLGTVSTWKRRLAANCGMPMRGTCLKHCIQRQPSVACRAKPPGNSLIAPKALIVVCTPVLLVGYWVVAPKRLCRCAVASSPAAKPACLLAPALSRHPIHPAN